MREKCSVALCTYNGGLYIQRQLESILNQTVKVDEIIICDDSSNDRTVDIADEILKTAGIPYKITVNKPRLGVTKNFEKCIGLCTGDIIFLCDQDDIWLENKVEVLSSFFLDDATVLVFSDAYVIDKAGSVTCQSAFEKYNFLREGMSDYHIAEMFTRKQQGLNGCFMAIRKSLYSEIIPFYDDDEYKLYHDAWIQYCAGLTGKIVGIHDKLMCYRIHDSNATQSAGIQDKWLEVVTSGDAYDQRFWLHTFRRQRNTIMNEACKLYPNAKNVYYSKYKKCIKMYERLLYIKGKNKIFRVGALILSFLDGSYYYRDISRNIENTFMHQVKMLVRDIIFMLNW